MAANTDDRRHAGGPPPRRTVLPAVSGLAALAVAALLLLGVFGLTASARDLGVRNWLVVLFQIDSGIGDLPPDPLGLVNPFDIAILVLAGASFAGFWPGPGVPHRVSMAAAVALPLLGIPVLLLTRMAGRSGMLGGGIVLAVLMLISRRDVTALGVLGLAATVLSLAGDIASDASMPAVAVTIATGYVLLVCWFTALGVRLLRRR